MEFVRDTGEFREIKNNFTYGGDGKLVEMNDKLFRTYYFYDDHKNLTEAAKFLIVPGRGSNQDFLVAKTVYRFLYY